MLNPFPIQFLALLAYAVLRIIVGSVLVYLGLTHYQKRNELKHSLSNTNTLFGFFTALAVALVELSIGFMLIAGWYTQFAALTLIFTSFFLIIFHKSFASPYFPGRIFYILLTAIGLTLFVTGAGAFAFDLPI